MNTVASLPVRALPLPFAVLLVTLGAWAAAAALHLVSTADATAGAGYVAQAADGGAASGTALSVAPYGAMPQPVGHASGPVLPYGAMTRHAKDASVILPYGSFNHSATITDETFLPYGSVSPRYAP
ncbi:MAG: hypothetical protein ABWX83_15255 [Luteibacter sp.]